MLVELCLNPSLFGEIADLTLGLISEITYYWYIFLKKMAKTNND